MLHFMDRLNIGCGPFRAAGWLNTDCRIEQEGDPQPHTRYKAWDRTRPDVVTRGFPFRDQSFKRIYCGHVLEHLRWEDVPGFLAEIRRVGIPGGELMVVGPDVYKAIHLWSAGGLPWEEVTGALEWTERWDDGSPADGARHHWDCQEARVVWALQNSGFEEVVSHTLEEAEQAGGWGWPFVSFTRWQLCVSARLS